MFDPSKPLQIFGLSLILISIVVYLGSGTQFQWFSTACLGVFSYAIGLWKDLQSGENYE